MRPRQSLRTKHRREFSYTYKNCPIDEPKKTLTLSEETHKFLKVHFRREGIPIEDEQASEMISEFKKSVTLI